MYNKQNDTISEQTTVARSLKQIQWHSSIMRGSLDTSAFDYLVAEKKEGGALRLSSVLAVTGACVNTPIVQF